MLRLLRTESSHPDFQSLVRQLDAYLAVVDGPDHAFYAQYNTIAALKEVIVAYNGIEAVGCGAFKTYAEGTAEIKRMFTAPEGRRKGVAEAVLHALENWAMELGYQQFIMETGTKQNAAIALYLKSGYRQIDNYGQYAGLATSICFEKDCRLRK